MASCASCDIENITECFLQWKEKFLLYGEFCAQLSFAQGLLDEICSKDEEIKNKVEVIQISEIVSTLMNYLINLFIN